MKEIEQLKIRINGLDAEIESLRHELISEQEFSSGVLVALKQVLAALLPREPEVALALAENWQEASADFRTGPSDSALLEARHMLFVQLSQLGTWRRCAAE